LFVPSEAKFHTDFYQGHFNLLNWTLGSQVKNFNRKPEENKTKAVGDQKNLIFQNTFFYFMMNFFTRVQKIDGTKKFKF
jgi:hypothetical protein